MAPGTSSDSPPLQVQSQGRTQTTAKVEKLIEDHLAVQSLIRTYQVSFLCVEWLFEL